VSTCRSCGAEIRWAVSMSTGRRMPIDAEPTPDGNVLLHPGGGATVLAAGVPVPVGRSRYTSHFATCPHANTHRRTP
jgi:hypothetical protein